MRKLAWMLLAACPFVQASEQSDLQVNSSQGKTLSIQYFEGWDAPQIPIEELNPAAQIAEICGESVETLEEVILWMPAHGHGSSPTSLYPQENGCVVVDNVEFTMLGHWELRLSFKDGDKAVFNANISY